MSNQIRYHFLMPNQNHYINKSFVFLELQAAILIAFPQFPKSPLIVMNSKRIHSVISNAAKTVISQYVVLFVIFYF